MNKAEDYLNINRKSWNERTEAHMKSDFYDLEGFLNGANSLNSIELDLLGDVAGKRILHLQCHFGQDSISLSRMGAEVCGVDLSDVAIDKARELATQCGTSTRFICSDLYDLPKLLSEQFDVVFSSYGTIGWLPNLDRWAEVVSTFLKPGGHFVFAEFHPVLWMFDDNFEKIVYPYLNTGPITETQSGTYAAKDADLSLKTVTWNHGLSEVISSVLKHGLSVKAFREFDYSPYDCFRNTTTIGPKQHRIAHFDNKLPMVYALLAEKVG